MMMIRSLRILRVSHAATVAAPRRRALATAPGGAARCAWSKPLAESDPQTHQIIENEAKRQIGGLEVRLRSMKKIK